MCLLEDEFIQTNKVIPIDILTLIHDFYFSQELIYCSFVEFYDKKNILYKKEYYTGNKKRILYFSHNKNGKHSIYLDILESYDDIDFLYNNGKLVRKYYY